MSRFNYPPPEPALDKFQVATCRFIDTVHGYLAGNHLATTVDNTRAVCELLSGLAADLKKRGLIPKGLSLVYKFELDPDQEPDIFDLPAIELRKKARAGSNFSKHADRDADKTFSYHFRSGIDMLIFNMAQDYEILHCALIRHGLLDRSSEHLYPIQRSLLVDFNYYRDIYHPAYLNSQSHHDAGLTPSENLLLQFFDINNRMEDKEDVEVPAGAVAAILLRKQGIFVEKEKLPEVAQQIRSLGIWPVTTQTNAKLIRRAETTPTAKPEV